MSLPNLAPRSGAWQQPMFLSSSALLVNEFRVLDEITRVNLIPNRSQTKQSRHLARVPNSEQEITEDSWEEPTDSWTSIHHKPRLALFKLAHLDNGPRPEGLENDRGTHTSFINDKERVCCVTSGL